MLVGVSCRNLSWCVALLEAESLWLASGGRWMGRLGWLVSTNINTCGSEISEICRGMLQPHWLLVSSVVKATDVC